MGRECGFARVRVRHQISVVVDRRSVTSFLRVMHVTTKVADRAGREAVMHACKLEDTRDPCYNIAHAPTCYGRRVPWVRTGVDM